MFNWKSAKSVQDTHSQYPRFFVYKIATYRQEAVIIYLGNIFLSPEFYTFFLPCAKTLQFKIFAGTPQRYVLPAIQNWNDSS